MRPKDRGPLDVFARFVHSQVAGSMVLLGCTLAAIFWANSPWAATYVDLTHTPIAVSWGEATFALSLQHWINDLLMAVFFFVIGLEIKRELVVGQLSSLRRAVLPVSAALGGMIVPAVLYRAFNPAGEPSHGWGIPMATDIAFALGILALFGSRVPVGLKVFLTALAIADDLGAVLVIAIFYTEKLQVTALIVAALLLGVLAVANRMQRTHAALYAVLGLGVWLAIFASGVHATVAGVLVALCVPVRPARDPRESIAMAAGRLEELQQRRLTREGTTQPEALEDIEVLHEAAGDMRPPGLALEKALHPCVVFAILPLFAFFNAGVTLEGGASQALDSRIGWGVICGLVFGKQIGITLFSWLAVRSGRAALPVGVRWGQIYGAACLGGVGFTMSLFIGDLAFVSDAWIAQAKVGILVASLVSGVWGLAILRFALPGRKPASSSVTPTVAPQSSSRASRARS